MTTTNTETTKPWVFVHWSKTDLAYVAGVLQTMNQQGFKDADSRASYIRNVTERELNRRLEDGKTDAFDFSTGGFTVCFVKWDDGQWHAIATVSPYTCAVFIAKMNIPNQECFISEEPNGTGGFYKGVRVRSMLRSWAAD